jgi:DNA-binding CsgD family transcriptional regulator
MTMNMLENSVMRVRRVILEGCASGLTQEAIAKYLRDQGIYPAAKENDVKNTIAQMRLEAGCNHNTGLVARLNYRVGVGPNESRRLLADIPPRLLTKEEKVILYSLAYDYSTAWIATNLSLSEDTIRTKIGIMCVNAGAYSREQLVHFYVQWGLQ